MKEKDLQTIELQGLSAKTMAYLLDCIYSEQVLFTIENVQEILPAAALLQLNGKWNEWKQINNSLLTSYWLCLALLRDKSRLRRVPQKPTRSAQLPWHTRLCRAAQLRRPQVRHAGVHLRAFRADCAKQRRVLSAEGVRARDAHQVQRDRGHQRGGRLQLCAQLDQLWQEEPRAGARQAHGPRALASPLATIPHRTYRIYLLT